MDSQKKDRAKKAANKSARQSNFWSRHKRVRKWLGSIVGIFALLIIVLFVWFRLSPWPGAMIIRWVFESNGAKTTQALEKHDPASGVAVISNQQYRQGDDNAKLDVYIPESTQKNSKKLPVVIWTHGGAWISGDKTDAAAYFELLALKGYTVIAPNYSLAPEKSYPTPIHQLNDMYAYIQQNADRFYADTGQIVLAGDSAGSQLSAQMAAIVTNPSYAKEVGISPNLASHQLKGVILNCGIYKMEELAHPQQNLSKLIGWGDDVVVWSYSGTHDFTDSIIRQMSPYYHVTKNFPPTFITGGNDDPLTNVQSKPFAHELQSLGVPTDTLFYPDNYQPALPHEYQFDLNIDAAQQALDTMVRFLGKHTQ